MSNIKTSDTNMNFKPIELTPSELDSVVGGNPWAAVASFLEMRQRQQRKAEEYVLTFI
jgi:hypothetical protein